MSQNSQTIAIKENNKTKLVSAYELRLYNDNGHPADIIAKGNSSHFSQTVRNLSPLIINYHMRASHHGLTYFSSGESNRVSGLDYSWDLTVAPSDRRKSRKEFAAARVAIISATHWTGN